MKRKTKIIIPVIIGVILISIGVIIYLTLFIGPKDLNVEYSAQDFISLQNKLGYNLELPKDYSDKNYKMTYNGSKEVKIDITQEEVTALLNSDNISEVGLNNSQVRLNDDGTLEASGVADIKFITENFFSEEDLKSIPSFIIPEKAPLYVKASISIKDNKIEIEPEKIKIGVFDIPESLLTEDNIENMEKSFEKMVKDIPQLSINSLKIEDGKIIFDGTIPSDISFENK